jgi:hypothetical protein
MSFRRDYKSADEILPVRNLPVSRRIDQPQFSGRVLDFCDIGVGTQGQDKIRGQNSEEFGSRMLMKQRLYKPAFLTQKVIITTPGKSQADLDSGRQVRNQKF